MNIKRLSIIGIILLICATTGLFAQSEKTITGWSFGGVPAIAYNSDLGFQYGAVLNLYNYGDGSNYPDYLYSIYLEWSRFTKGSGVNTIFFDSKYLLPRDIRLTAELSYLTEDALPFYGFNGYNQNYLADWEDDEADDYVTRVFYRHKRNNLKLTSDFQMPYKSTDFGIIAGFGFLNFDIGSVDVEALNEDSDDPLPVYVTADSAGLYDYYVNEGWIKADEKNGGQVNYLKAGLVYDTRDNEANPMRGMWSEALVTSALGFLGSDFPYTTLTLTHRQYFTVIPKDLSLTYRLGYQGVIAGDIPFFMLPFYQSSYKMTEGLGGSKSLRGILKNRVVGNAIAFGNFEARWKFFRTVVFNQNLYLALNTFVDAGQVLTQYSHDDYDPDSLGGADEKLHVAYGGGLRIALNENFIIAVDYGMAADEQDGGSGLYIGLGYLY